jgi:3-phosphoshikimate 1-carboxyvinyltransferase
MRTARGELNVQSYTVYPAKGICGEINVPGDKSISHRSLILGSLAKGTTTVRGLLRGEDNMATLKAFQLMGITTRDDGDTLTIFGNGLHGLIEPEDVVDCGNSGTSMRLLCGLLAAQDFFSVLTGDQYLRKRPMKRVITPLSQMGAGIYGRCGGEKAPLAIIGQKLRGIDYASPVSSAQIKSALMLAGLYVEGETRVTEPSLSRDHSERMFRYFGADVETFTGGVVVRGGRELEGRDIDVPGDISSAAFFIVAALIVPGSELLIRGVGVNPTRTGILDILSSMGASIELLDRREVSGEPVADILVRSSNLKGIEIKGDVVPRAIDEFPVISVANLRLAGVNVEETVDGMVIDGVERLAGCAAESRGDHRIAMSMLVAGLAAAGEISVDETACIATSFPTFLSLIQKVALR